MLLGTPVVCALFLWRVFASSSPQKLVERALKKMEKDYKGQIYYALPCETYQNGRTELGVLAVLDARMHFESVLGDKSFDINYARIRAYLFQDKTAAGVTAAGLRVLLVATDQGSADFGLPAWGEENLRTAIKAAAGISPLPSPK